MRLAKNQPSLCHTKLSKRANTHGAPTCASEHPPPRQPSSGSGKIPELPMAPQQNTKNIELSTKGYTCRMVETDSKWMKSEWMQDQAAIWSWSCFGKSAKVRLHDKSFSNWSGALNFSKHPLEHLTHFLLKISVKYSLLLSLSLLLSFAVSLFLFRGRATVESWLSSELTTSTLTASFFVSGSPSSPLAKSTDGREARGTNAISPLQSWLKLAEGNKCVMKKSSSRSIIVTIISYLSLMQYHQYNIESADLSRRIQPSYLRM